MLIVNPVGEGAGHYYQDSQGRWCGAGRGDLGLDGRVSHRALDAVLAGRRPEDRSQLSDRRPRHRRAGWDLIFTAPKSISLLTALDPGGAGGIVTASHRRACADAFVWLETHGCWARRQGGVAMTSGFVAARFGHHTNAAGEPHLHTHVLIANLAHVADGRWSALDGSGLWLNRRAVAAVYHLALRQQLLAAGLRPEWIVHGDGTADIADVPRRAIEATSSRRRQIQSRLSAQDDPAPLTRVAAQRLSRAQTVQASSWAERSLAAGFGPDDAHRVIDRATRRATGSVGTEADAARLVGDVTAWLAARRSTFGLVDVLQALSAVHAQGTTGTEAHRWARSFHDASPLADDGRRTSTLAVAEDRALVAAALARSPGVGPPTAGPDRVTVGTRDDAPGEGRHLTARGGVKILASPAATTTGDWPVTRAKGGFVSQAEAVDAARIVWQRAGQTVAVMTVSEVAARRWRALTGLDSHEPGAAPPTVLIVDRADRRPTPELRRILDDAARNATTVVLVEGGTLPPRRAALSQGLGWSADQLGRVTPEVGPRSAAASLTAGRLEVCQRGHDAIDRVVDHWSRWRGQGDAPRMVALGPAECDELNRRARGVLRATGGVTGDEVVIGGRPFAVGDEVVATRRAALPAGAAGQVTSVDRRGSMSVHWSDGAVSVDAWNGRSLRHAYATTPGMLRFDDRPLVILGDPGHLGHHASRVVAAGLVAATGPRPVPEPTGRVHDGHPVPGGRDGPSPLAGVAALDGITALDGIAALKDRRRHLARELEASRPADPRGDRRRLEEDRAWRRSSGQDPGGDPGWERREAGVLAAEEALTRWERDHREALAEWVAGGEDLHARVDALIRVAESPSASDGGLGRPPADAAGRDQWRRAARRSILAGERSPIDRTPIERSPIDRTRVDRTPTERAVAADHRQRTDELRRSSDLGL